MAFSPLFVSQECKIDPEAEAYRYTGSPPENIKPFPKGFKGANLWTKDECYIWVSSDGEELTYYGQMPPAGHWMYDRDINGDESFESNYFHLSYPRESESWSNWLMRHGIAPNQLFMMKAWAPVWTFTNDYFDGPDADVDYPWEFAYAPSIKPALHFHRWKKYWQEVRQSKRAYAKRKKIEDARILKLVGYWRIKWEIHHKTDHEGWPIRETGRHAELFSILNLNMWKHRGGRWYSGHHRLLRVDEDGPGDKNSVKTKLIEAALIKFPHVSKEQLEKVSAYWR